MTTQALTAATFEQTVLDNDIVLVDFWASSYPASQDHSLPPHWSRSSPASAGWTWTRFAPSSPSHRPPAPRPEPHQPKREPICPTH